MPTFSALPSGSIRAQIRLRGHPKESKTFSSRIEAEAWAKAREAALLRVRADAAFQGLSTDITLRSAWSLYSQSSDFSDKAQSTRDREDDAIVHVLRLLGDVPVSHITASVIQKSFIDKRRREKTARGTSVSSDTIRIEKALLSAILAYCVREGILGANPAASSFRMPARKPREGRIPVADEMKLHEAAFAYVARSNRTNANLLGWLSFIFSTATRPGEAAKIELSWVHLATREVHIPRTGHKTRKPRIILLDDSLLKLVSGFYRTARSIGSPYLFFSYTQRSGYMPYRYYHPWRAICKLAGIPPGVVPHLVRHEFISRLFETTSLSDSQIATLVGDVHVLSLEPYKHLRVNALRADLEAHKKQYIENHKASVQKLKDSGII